MFILIFHGDLNYRKNTNILAEWWLSPLASSCILAGQFLTVHHITVVGSYVDGVWQDFPFISVISQVDLNYSIIMIMQLANFDNIRGPDSFFGLID